MAASDKPPARTREASPTPPLKRGQRQPRRGEVYELALTEVPQTEPSVQPQAELKQLWLGVYLPVLPLEALTDAMQPAAVFEEQQGVRKILLANSAAMAAGVGPGLTINAALALLPELTLEERDLLREAQVLRELGEWSGKFTSFTVVEPPSLLLLEIAGSLNLFGGIRALRQRIVDGLQAQGFHVSVAIAPTPLAATWLANAGHKVCIRDPRNLVGRLAALPIACTGWPEAVHAALKGMGIATVGEALRLPRQGFAKRFGAKRLLELDRALGKLPDPRMSFRSPEPFITDADLNEEQSDASLLLNVCRELLVRLERFLTSRQVAVQQIEFSFFHLQLPATHLSLGCVQPDRAVLHWLDLLGIRFEQLALPAPVIAIRLCAGQGHEFTAESGALPFSRQQAQRQDTAITHLAERLAARIGDESVHGIHTVAEHRPQYAWDTCYQFDEAPRCASGPVVEVNSHAPELLADIRRTQHLVLRRPLWMLSEPEPLHTDRDQPCYQGLLTLVSGPERLETGWWDDDGIARDYFVAVNPQGVHLWIFRDRKRNERCWYLHGMFG